MIFLRVSNVLWTLQIFKIILLLVRGSVTNNNGFWVGFIDAFFTVVLNYNQIQQLTINLLPRTRPIRALLFQFSYNF
jgi:hypothetical protein